MQKVFKKIGIIFNNDVAESVSIAKQLNQKIENSELFEISDMSEDIELAVAVGGDGTFLKCSRFFSNYDIPILGINVGRLGYLAQAKPNETDKVINKLENSDFKIENRLMLKSLDNVALNDIVVKGETCARSSTFDLYINEKIICSYVADGIIVATPTGSTAYSLSAGGPIVSPDLDCFLIIPICAHTLNARPIIVPNSETIKIKSHEKNQEFNVSFDGQVDKILKDEVIITKNENYAKLLILNHNKDRFYDILKEKLHWSLAPNK